MGQTHLSMDRETFCFQGLSLRMPMPKPERKNSSPVVTRSHFCEASNSSTAESQIKACSLLPAGAESKEPRVARSPHPAHTAVDSLRLCFLGDGLPFACPFTVPPPPQPGQPLVCLLTCPAQPGWPQLRSRNCVFPCAGTWYSTPPASGSRCPRSSALQLRR